MVLIGGSILLLAVRRLREYRLKERYTLIFLFTGLPFLVLSLFPGVPGWVALKLGIEYRTLSLLCVVTFFLLMTLELLTIVSVQDRRISTLTQMVAILMEERQNGSNPPANPK